MLADGDPTPKPLRRLATRTLLENVIQTLEQIGVHDIAIIAGEHGDQIARLLPGISTISSNPASAVADVLCAVRRH